jgi:hypothetical protein
MTEVFMKIEFADIKNKQGTTRNLNIYYTLYFKISTLGNYHINFMFAKNFTNGVANTNSGSMEQQGTVERKNLH